MTEPHRDRTRYYRPDGLTKPFATVEIQSADPPDPEGLAIALERILTIAAEAMQVDDPPVVFTSGIDDVARIAQEALERHRRPARAGPLASGRPDELNRDHHGDWRWVQTREAAPREHEETGEPVVVEHWSRFSGHAVQVDIRLRTSNEREVNDWKGRDEVRSCGEWSIDLNRRKVLEGGFSDPRAALRTIDHKLGGLLDHSVMTMWSEEEISALEGRKIVYHNQPAVIRRVQLPIIVLAGDPDPIRMPWETSADAELDETHTTNVLDPHIWWWRPEPEDQITTESEVSQA